MDRLNLLCHKLILCWGGRVHASVFCVRCHQSSSHICRSSWQATYSSSSQSLPSSLSFSDCTWLSDFLCPLKGLLDFGTRRLLLSQAGEAWHSEMQYLSVPDNRIIYSLLSYHVMYKLGLGWDEYTFLKYLIFCGEPTGMYALIIVSFLREQWREMPLSLHFWNALNCAVVLSRRWEKGIPKWWKYHLTLPTSTR